MLNDPITVWNVKTTKAAFYTFVAGLVTAVIVSIFAPYGYIVGPIIFLTTCLVSYNMSCVVLGQCKSWAVILFVIYMIYFVLTIVGAVFAHKAKTPINALRNATKLR